MTKVTSNGDGWDKTYIFQGNEHDDCIVDQSRVVSFSEIKVREFNSQIPTFLGKALKLHDLHLSLRRHLWAHVSSVSAVVVVIRCPVRRWCGIILK